MLLLYVGDGYRVSFIPNSVYEVKKTRDHWGECYRIFDECEDWYRYDENFVKENFVPFEEKNSVKPSERFLK